MRSYIILLFSVVSLTSFACSSEESPGDPSPSPDDDSSTGDAGPSGASCSCSVTVNGTKKVIACGGQACVGGASYQCDDDAVITESGDACASSSPDAGPETSNATTVPCAYFDFDASEDVETCDAATQYCLRSYPSRLGPGSNNVCVPKPSGCNACSCASANAEAAWKKANDNTINCTGATIVCENKDGAIVVDCVK